VRRISEETDSGNLRKIAAALIGHGHALAGRPAEAVSYLEQSCAHQESHIWLVCVDTNYLADAYRRAGRLDEAFSMATRALEVAKRFEHVGRQAHALKTLGDASLASGACREALDLYERALAVAEERSMKPLVAHCHAGLGEGYLRTGRDDLARPHFGIAQSMYEAMGMQYWLAT
jgi:tetratricopeptide (TPR) repeat protein